jgi:hypothetical protein
MVRNVAIATVTYTEMTDSSGESPAPTWLPASPQVIGALVSQGSKSQMQVTVSTRVIVIVAGPT